jgi:hypothetical protein
VGSAQCIKWTQPLTVGPHAGAPCFCPCMQIVPCNKLYPHNWSVCPFLHRGEKARRRDPRSYVYQPLPCPFDKKV